LIEAKKADEGRKQLQRLIDQPNPLRERALFNVAGSYAQEGKKDEARRAYAEAIRSLQTKQRDAADNELLEMAKQNLARLATDPPPPQGGQGGGGQDQNQNQNQDQKNQDSKGQDNKDPKNQDQKGNENKDNKDQNPGDGKDQKDKNDPKDQKDQQGKGDQDQDKKDQKDKGDQKDQKKDPSQDGQEKQNDSGEGDQQNNPPPQGMRTGKKEFKEKGDMAEDDAKRILEALKQRETGLQKKFMRQKSKGDYSDDGGEKDW
jgi:Ca-activated chloride channel homolog